MIDIFGFDAGRGLAPSAVIARAIRLATCRSSLLSSFRGVGS